MIDERAERFSVLIRFVSARCERLLAGAEPDIMQTLAIMNMHLAEAQKIAAEVSRESLHKVTIELKHPLPGDTEVDRVMGP